MAADALPDVSTIFMSDKFSDASLILVEEGPAQTGDKRPLEQQEELPAHGVVLLGTSGYCKAKLENWTTTGGSDNSSKLTIQMPVPRGQLDMGRLLVKGMYYPKLDLAGISQQQQLQLLLLADRYEVPKVVAAASNALEAVPQEWETTMAIFQAPPGCQDSPACSSVFRAAATKLQQQLGDLELAHNDPAAGAKQRQLLELPHAALKQLLADPATKVSSENTVFYTIQAWYVHQVGNQGCAVSAEQVQELVQLVRMRHCSQLYVATVIAPSALASSFGPAELALATAISGAGASAWQAAKDAENSVLAKHPAWSADKRPASAWQQSLEWRLPLSELQRALEQHLADTGRITQFLDCPTTFTRQGHELRLQLQCFSSTEADQPSAISLGAFLRVSNLSSGGVSRVTYSFEVVPAGAARGELGPISRGLKDGGSGYGWPKAISLGSVKTWQEAVALLRQQGLVHAGSDDAGKLLLRRLNVTEIQ